MPMFSFVASSLLALGGVVACTAGILTTEWQPFAIGGVLLFGAAIFAILYNGTRRIPHAAQNSQRGE